MQSCEEESARSSHSVGGAVKMVTVNLLEHAKLLLEPLVILRAVTVTRDRPIVSPGSWKWLRAFGRKAAT